MRNRRLHLDIEAFLSSKPKNFRQFLDSLTRTQSFAQFMVPLNRQPCLLTLILVHMSSFCYPFHSMEERSRGVMCFP